MEFLTMFPTTGTEETIGNDDDIYALEALLADSEMELPSTVGTCSDKKSANFVPQIREDETFAEAFNSDSGPSTSSRKPTLMKENEKESSVDSSDDEEVNNFLERKYNEYGCDINRNLKQKAKEERELQVAKEVEFDSKNQLPSGSEKLPSGVRNPHNPVKRKSLITNSFNQKITTENSKNINHFSSASNTETVSAGSITVPSSLNPQSTSSPIYTDPIFGLRLINPLVSSAVLTQRMADRKAVPFGNLLFHTERGDLAKDWVIAGILVSKSAIKTAKNGSLYSIWKLSDLKGDIKMISLFLFKSAHKELWKTSTGMAVAILNPSVLEKRNGTGDIACLSIDNSQKIMILGQSKDLGVCKAKKKNGEPCAATININVCDYCIFHMKQEFGKMSNRAELQSSTSGRGLNELRNKILGKSEVFYAGKSFSAIPAKKSAKLVAKDAKRLSLLSEYAVSPFASSMNHISTAKITTIPYAERGGVTTKVAGNVESTARQRLQDIARLKILQEESSEQANSALSSSPSTSKLSNQSDISTSEIFKNKTFSFSTTTPQLKREDFSFVVTIPNSRAESAKLKAVEIVKKKPIAKANPNFLRGSSEGRKRAIDDLNEEFDKISKRKKTEEEQKLEDRKTRIQRILDATSSHADLIEARHLQDQEKYFNKLEKKEALEEKLLNTFKVPCKAVICKKCNYTAFSAADRCKEEKHSLKVIDTQKRFFQCKDCGNRVTTLHKMPTLSCKNCSSSRWERAAMIRERKIFDGTDGLSIRGDEETFIGSLSSKVHLNLLVPDE